MQRSLLCPFPVTSAHPQAAELTDGCIAWARGRGLLPDESERTLDKVRSYSALAARCYPSAPLDRLAAICDYYSWLFFFDDVCENLSLHGADPQGILRLLSDVYALLRGQPARASHPRFVDALADIWRRIAEPCPPFWRRRLAHHVENYVDGCVWEAQNRRLGRVPSRAVFEAMRMHTSTMYEFWDFMEYAGDYFLPDDVVEHPLVAELRRTGNAIASFANDIYSLRKEAENQDVHNLVLVLMHEEHVDIDAASERARRRHPRCPSFALSRPRTAPATLYGHHRPAATPLRRGHAHLDTRQLRLVARYAPLQSARATARRRISCRPLSRFQRASACAENPKAEFLRLGGWAVIL